jgi:hypothetical protein
MVRVGILQDFWTKESDGLPTRHSPQHRTGCSRLAQGARSDVAWEASEPRRRFELLFTDALVSSLPSRLLHHRHGRQCRRGPITRRPTWLTGAEVGPVLFERGIRGPISEENMMTDSGMVVTPQPEASEAGRDILAAGGNAIDAVIATALVQTVVDPLMCGVAGFGSLAAYLPSKKVHAYYDFHSPAPAAVRPDMWESLIESEARDGYGFVLKGHVNDVGYQSICVPASLKAYSEVHRDHGRLPWAELFGPAIAYAEGGWDVRPHVHTFWSEEGMMGRVGNAERISFTPAARELYCRPDGSPKRVGDRVVNRDYGGVLRAIAKNGAKSF